ncbi:MbtH protein [Actinokineospora baliensis]|uniref:MbtH family protein n=1 Tax=Actinokineospora baliensis TaxID=547056 RepID=UPI001957BFA0|nr:MbtH family protein [Actinokineospora baliensis]MBM7775492.1 MbtH protein [Actinokineospora baliensis]
MFLDDDNTTQTCKVVINDEEQYSIWPAQWDNPAGWRDVGVAGSKADCLSHIEQVWTDITPLSVRRSVAERTA